MIGLLAGYLEAKKWDTDKFDGLGKPHLIYQGNQEWADLSSRILLAMKYRFRVKLVGAEWLNTNPCDHQKYLEEKKDGALRAFVYHFNGQDDKPGWIQSYSKDVVSCPWK